VKYLSLILTTEGIKIDLEKVRAIAEWLKPALHDLKGVRRFLRFTNFYRRFIKDFSKITTLLNNLLKKDVAL
jgi:hypothetical protein